VEGVELKYPDNDRSKGRVTNITDTARSWKLEPGVEGLVPRIGDELDQEEEETCITARSSRPSQGGRGFLVLEVDPQKRRASASASSRPWQTRGGAFVRAAFGRHELEGRGTRTSPSRLFVGCPARTTAGPSSRTRLEPSRARRTIGAYYKGDMVKASCSTSIVERRSASASGIKQLATDPHESTLQTLKKAVVTCTIYGDRDGGAARSPSATACGLHPQVRPVARPPGEQRPDRFAVGGEGRRQVTAVDKATRKLSLSIKARREVEEEKQAMAGLRLLRFGRQPRRTSSARH